MQIFQTSIPACNVLKQILCEVAVTVGIFTLLHVEFIAFEPFVWQRLDFIEANMYSWI